MNEKRLKQLEKLLKKALALSDDLEFLFDAETNHINEYSTSDEVLSGISEGRKAINQAAVYLIAAREAAAKAEIIDPMQTRLDEFDGAKRDE